MSIKQIYYDVFDAHTQGSPVYQTGLDLTNFFSIPDIRPDNMKIAAKMILNDETIGVQYNQAKFVFP